MVERRRRHSGRSSSSRTITFAISAFAGGTGDLIGIPLGDPITTQSITATVGAPVSFQSLFGNFTGIVTLTDDEGPATNRVVDVFALGTFVPANPGPLDTFDPGPMSLTFSATQTGGPNSQVSASYTIASPPAGVPEPMTLSLLGLGLVGTALAARRRRS